VSAGCPIVLHQKYFPKKNPANKKVSEGPKLFPEYIYIQNYMSLRCGQHRKMTGALQRLIFQRHLDRTLATRFWYPLRVGCRARETLKRGVNLKPQGPRGFAVLASIFIGLN
jgi:hypothetical protein